ncbi:SRPBCC domain-containing protein [Streptomyces sp. R21]|uniref:SRPBCC domain-containing protein n=1 Tax=Streptomyces sp. R21 TaxID=3238627 RepID=A0AB39PAE0_9ACTN
MDHEVFVPVPVERLREALADPARVARAVPGFQQDAGTPPVSGRLKVRVGGHTITYRGAVRVAEQGDDAYTVEGDATEARGSGSVKLALSLRLVPADGGTTLAFGGTARGDGRVAELPADAVASAGARLLNRFAENLADGAADEPLGSEPQPQPEETPDAGASETPSASEASEQEPPSSPSVFETEVPPPSLDPLAEDFTEELGEDLDDAEEALAGASFPGVRADPMAEAAHARRTMIGRSAEEVDHAPPRGRYAPVPAPEAAAARATLRWAAPAAALALASAIAVTRALRKRR